MKKIYLVVACVMAAYFVLTMAVFPKAYQDANVGVPHPKLETQLSAQKIKLGESFEITLSASNQGSDADLQTVTVEFPQNDNLDNVKIISYDFLQSPKSFLKGKEIGSDYTGGKTLVQSKYPFLEAYSRPAKIGSSYTMTLQVTPTQAETYTINAKTVAMPHINEQSHFPISGTLDQQNEFVQQYTVEVTP